MKRNSAVLSFVLIVCLLISNCTTVIASGGETANVVIKTDKFKCLPGEDVQVTLKVATNYNSLAMRWFVLYSKNVFEIGENDGNFTVTDNFSYYEGNASFNATSRVPYPEGYSSDDYSIALVQWTGGGKDLSVFNHPELLTCFKFNLKVKDDAPLGERGKIFIPQNSSYYDMALEDPNDPTTYYNATQLKCTFNEVIVTVKSDTTPELVKVEGTDIVIDETRGMIYGFPEVFLDSENINDYVQATNDASVKFEPCEAGSGTGSLIKLMDGETVLETYEVVFLGDVNGDAVADEADFVLIDLFNSFYYIPDNESCEYFAMDVSKDGFVDESDLIILDLVIAFYGTIDQINGGIIFY